MTQANFIEASFCEEDGEGGAACRPCWALAWLHAPHTFHSTFFSHHFLQHPALRKQPFFNTHYTYHTPSGRTCVEELAPQELPAQRHGRHRVLGVLLVDVQQPAGGGQGGAGTGPPGSALLRCAA